LETLWEIYDIRAELLEKNRELGGPEIRKEIMINAAK
jgi:hypothetical protein